MITLYPSIEELDDAKANASCAIADLACDHYENNVLILQSAGILDGLSIILRNGPDDAEAEAALAIGSLACDHDEGSVLPAQSATRRRFRGS